MPVLTAFEPETIVSDVIEDQPKSEIFSNSSSVEICIERPEQSEQQELVARALRGEEEAFNDIFNSYGSLMLRTASMIVGDRDIAEDVVQDALIQVWRHLPELREAGALRSWLMRIVVNQCISFKRRLARSTAFMRQSLCEQETDLMAQIADDHKGRTERDWDLAEATKNLPAKQRDVIVLHYYHGMTLPEMAKSLNTSENTLKKRIQTALASLRGVMRANALNDAFGTPATKNVS